MSHNFLAIDLGAESGRAILATLDQAHLSLTEIHRFANNPVRLPDGLHWDILRLWSEIKTALHIATHQHHRFNSMGSASIHGGWITACSIERVRSSAILIIIATAAPMAWLKPPSSVCPANASSI